MRDNLRSKVIRLAHANPSLRPHLLPLLAERGRIAAEGFNPPKAGYSFRVRIPINSAKLALVPNGEEKLFDHIISAVKAVEGDGDEGFEDGGVFYMAVFMPLEETMNDAEKKLSGVLKRAIASVSGQLKGVISTRPFKITEGEEYPD